MSNRTRSTFRELHARVARIAAALTRHGFKAGDRLAILLPNEARLHRARLCVRLARSHRGSVEHAALGQRNRRHPHRCQPARLDSPFVAAGPDRASSMATGARPGAVGRSSDDSIPDSHLRSGSDSRSHLHQRHDWPTERCRDDACEYSGERLSHQLLASLRGRGGASACGADFSHRGFSVSCSPRRLLAPVRSRFQSSVRKPSARLSNANASRHTVLVPTMINLLTQFPELQKYDLSSLRAFGIRRISHGS